MTVIVYRDGVVASDSRETSKSVVWNDRSPKLYRLSDGSIFGGAGRSSNIEVLKRTVEESIKKADANGTKHLSGIIKGVEAILYDGKEVFLYEGGWERWKVSYLAIGSGFEVALGALEMGASAVEAVKVAIRRNIHCGGRVQQMGFK